ncbi:MAG: ribosomal protein S18-alanine N-acetyltransferase [Thermoplasmatales archaeon]|nr:ribosomal protein S18-alanine N-acetyltransferase [Thermoplasmatales archaeon]
MAIRKFEYRDLDAVLKIANESFPEKYSSDFLIYLWTSYPDGFLVAEKNNEVVGFIISVKVSKTDLRVLMLAVSKKYRRQSIGKSLLRELAIRFPEVRRIFLEVRVDNEGAIKFYQKNGFAIKDIIEDFYTDGSPAYIMEKIIF